MCVWNQCRIMNECIFVVQICCYNKCGMLLEELNPHLPFGDHLLGNFFHFFDKNKRVFKKVV